MPFAYTYMNDLGLISPEKTRYFQRSTEKSSHNKFKKFIRLGALELELGVETLEGMEGR